MCKIMYLICFLILFASSPKALAEPLAEANGKTGLNIIGQELMMVQQDNATPFETSQNKLCIDGTSANGRDIIDYWMDLECSFCKINDVLLAQRTIPNICLVVRHSPTVGGDSIKKALAYEALHGNSANAANMFWLNIRNRPINHILSLL